MSSWSNQTTLTESAGPIVEAWVDGSCLNNGDPDAVGGAGCVIKSDEERDSDEFQCPIHLDRRITNTLAEYAAVIEALECVQDEHSTDVVVHIYNDSKSIVRQIQGRYQVNKVHLEEPCQETRRFLNEFRDWRIEQLSESESCHIQRADKLAEAAARGDGQ